MPYVSIFLHLHHCKFDVRPQIFIFRQNVSTVVNLHNRVLPEVCAAALNTVNVEISILSSNCWLTLVAVDFDCCCYTLIHVSCNALLTFLVILVTI